MSSPCCATPKLKRNAFSSTLFPEASFSPHFFSPSYSLLLLKSVGFKFCLLFPLLVLLDDGPDWFVRLGILLQLRDEFVKLLLSLLSAFQASLQELRVVSRSQLFLRWHHPVRERRATNADDCSSHQDFYPQSPVERLLGRHFYVQR